MHKVVIGIIMLKKTIIAIFVLGFLNGCAQNTAFLGPVYTFTTSGSISQTGLSLGSDMVITSLTGQNTGENVKKLFTPQKKHSEFQRLIKKRVKTTRKKINLIKLKTHKPQS